MTALATQRVYQGLIAAQTSLTDAENVRSFAPMSHFFDEQAEVSANEGSSEDEPAIKKKKTTRRQKIASSDEDEDDEDDEEQARKEFGGFVVEDDDEENEGNAEDDDKSDKSGSASDEADLLEDDLDLVNENIGKRVGGRVEISDDEEDRARIGRDLFTGGDDLNELRPEHRSMQRSASVSSRSSYEEEDNFIVHDDNAANRRRYQNDRPARNQAEIAEAQEIFGFESEDVLGNIDDMFADLDEEEGVLEPSRQEHTLIGVIEPEDLAKHDTEERKILFNDMPERFQLRAIAVTNAEDDELSMEALWIQQRAFEAASVISSQEGLGYALVNMGTRSREEIERDAPDKIQEVLKFIRNQNYEVPFIAFYRKEHVDNVLNYLDLWTIYEYDEKWMHFRDRKNRLKSLFTRMSSFIGELSAPDELIRPITEKDIQDLTSAQTGEEVMDCYEHFQLYYANCLTRMVQYEIDQVDDPEQRPAALPKLTPRNDKYWNCAANGPGAVAACFGLTAEQLAENFEYRRHHCVSDARTPVEVATAHLTELFPDTERILEGAVYVMAYQMSREPTIRRKMREFFRLNAKLRANPTKRGSIDIDEAHPLYAKRYISGKPIRELVGSEFLLYDQAKTNNLMNIEIYVEREGEYSLLSELQRENYWWVDDNTDASLQWDVHRSAALRMCAERFLVPQLSKETHDTLIAEAKECVLREARIYFEARIMQGRYRPDFAYYTEEEGPENIDANTPEVRLISISPASDVNSEMTAIALDPNGIVTDTCPVTFRSRFDPQNGAGGNNRNEGNVSLRAFIQMCRAHRPHVIAVGASEMRAVNLQRDIERTIKQAVEEEKLPQNIPVVFVTAEAAKVYAKSTMAEQEFPTYTLAQRLTVSIGRCLLDPLVEYAHLCNPAQDYLGVRIHALQDLVPAAEIQWCYQREFINRVSEVGVDINYCLEYPHTANVLQFVCGLGPRKAAHMLQLLRHQNAILDSRSKLVTLCNLGPTIFVNAAGFIRIDVEKMRATAEDYVEQLDGSRVHPETYEWARKMAIDALEFEDTNDPAAAIEEIIAQPDRLKDLDLDAFAEELNRQGFGNKSITLYDIRAELNNQYKDLRFTPYFPMGLELFKELVPNHEIYMDGKLIHGRVQRMVVRRGQFDPEGTKFQKPLRASDGWECPDCHKVYGEFSDVAYNHMGMPVCPGRAVGVSVALEDGVRGFIPRDNLSDDKTSFDAPGDILRIGQNIVCRVVEFEEEKYSCKLSCQSSVLQQAPGVTHDTYWDTEREDADKKAIEDFCKRSQAKTHFTKRVISHQSFHNVTHTDAERMLSTMSQGEAIIRPSSKSPNNLTVTWKVTDSIYQHVLIDEGKKKHAFNLGKELRINQDVFEDLDEILARHVTPLAEYVREVLNHKYYADSLRAEDTKEIEAHIRAQKEQAPGRIPYTFTASKTYPGKFVISYLLSRPRHEYFTVTPDGFRFRSQPHNALEKMIDWFKLHFRDPVPR